MRQLLALNHANKDEIISAQRRYRTRELKKYIKCHKNAIVIELAQDLEDIDMLPAVLFVVLR